MYALKFTAAFKKGYRRIQKRGWDMAFLDTVIEQLRLGKPLARQCKDHLLKGAFEGFHECHIRPDRLLIYLVEDEVLTLTLVSTGTHADLLNL